MTILTVSPKPLPFFSRVFSLLATLIVSVSVGEESGTVSGEAAIGNTGFWVVEGNAVRRETRPIYGARLRRSASMMT